MTKYIAVRVTKNLILKHTRWGTELYGPPEMETWLQEHIKTLIINRIHPTCLELLFFNEELLTLFILSFDYK